VKVGRYAAEEAASFCSVPRRAPRRGCRKYEVSARQSVARWQCHIPAGRYAICTCQRLPRQSRRRRRERPSASHREYKNQMGTMVNETSQAASPSPVLCRTKPASCVCLPCQEEMRKRALSSRHKQQNHGGARRKAKAGKHVVKEPVVSTGMNRTVAQRENRVCQPAASVCERCREMRRSRRNACAAALPAPTQRRPRHDAFPPRQ